MQDEYREATKNKKAKIFEEKGEESFSQKSSFSCTVGLLKKLAIQK